MSELTSRQPWEEDVLAVDRAFFTALVEGDGQALDGILADQFILVGVNDGAVVPRDVLVALVGRGQLRFNAIEADGSAVLLRRYGSTAIVVGRTEMRGSFDGTPFRATSRYTTCSWRIRVVGVWPPPKARRSSATDRILID